MKFISNTYIILSGLFLVIINIPFLLDPVSDINPIFVFAVKLITILLFIKYLKDTFSSGSPRRESIPLALLACSVLGSILSAGVLGILSFRFVWLGVFASLGIELSSLILILFLKNRAPNHFKKFFFYLLLLKIVTLYSAPFVLSLV